MFSFFKKKKRDYSHGDIRMVDGRHPIIYNNSQSQDAGVWRIWMFLLIFFLVLSFILYSYFQLQIVRGADLSKLAKGQYVQTNDIYNRGTIYFSTRDGELISAATQQGRYKIAIYPKNIKSEEKAQELYARLESFSELSKDDFIKKAMTDDPYEEIAHHVPEEQISELQENKPRNVGIYRENVRIYSGDANASHTIGFVAYNDAGDRGGRYGLEEFYDDVLLRDRTSSHVNVFAEVFADLRVLISDDTFEGDIVTTIEPTVQKELEKQIELFREKWDGREAGGIIINPQNGEIYAIASNPNFDLNNFQKYSSAIFQNPFSAKVFEMGSIVKPIIMAIGFDRGVVGPDTKFYDPGFVKVEKHTIHNFDKRGRGDVTMKQVLQQSLNTGMVVVMQNLSKETVRDYFARLGIGEKTGIDLPGELSGLTSNLDSSRDIEFANISFGQGMALTPIGIVSALSSLANGGYRVTPHLVREILYVNGLRHSPHHIDDAAQDDVGQIFSEKSVDEITKILISIVDEELQDGKQKLEHYSVAAKTGTAQIPSPTGGYYSDRHLHSFFGYFPAYQPKFLVFLYLREPKNVKYSSQTLFDPFMSVVRFLVNYYDVPPDR